MYQYIYDHFLSDPRYAKALREIEKRLTDLGIFGRVDKLSPLKSLPEVVQEGIRRGAVAVIAVGNDDTARRVVEVISPHRLTFGYIPLGTPQTLARTLGIPEGLAACDVLSARRVVSLDIGRVNGQYFLGTVSIPQGRVTLDCEGKFRVTTVREGQVRICNFGENSDPTDGMLEAVIEQPLGLWSRRAGPPTILPLRQISITSVEPFIFVADGRRMQHKTVHVEVMPHYLKIIAGKRRDF